MKIDRKTKGALFLIAAALIWGLAFVAQKGAAGDIGVFTFTFMRSLVTCAVLLPICVFRVRQRRDSDEPVSLKKHLPHGLAMGLLTFSAIGFQQWGLLYTSAGKSGFVTALYIVIVPLLGLLFGRKPGLFVWIGTFFALTGSAFLALDFSEGITLGLGEGLTFLCAIAFSLHILYVDSRTMGMAPVLLCMMQFAVCMVIGLIGMIAFEKPTFSQITGNWLPILYVGGVSGAVGYTFQLIGQRYASPSVASLTMCLESVFATLGGWLIAGEVLSPLEYLGCALMLAGCLLAQRGKK